MDKLPEELVFEILSYNHNYNSRLNEINKRCNILFNKQKYKFYVNRIIKWYKQITFNVKENDFEIYVWTDKSDVIKYIRKYYDMKYFKIYPEYFVKKRKRHDLKEFIENNLNKDVNKRNKIELLNFLDNDTITTEELFYVGL
tara:strand:+ start:3479 stop:3904 length:426 start_codon:yes stop_codon:yes gene_type:complete